MQIEELFDIMNEIIENNPHLDKSSDGSLYFDVTILNSAGKIKAILILYGTDVTVSKNVLYF